MTERIPSTMDIVTLKWILGAAILPVITFFIWIWAKLRAIHDDTGSLRIMHEHPETTGFGTVGLAASIDKLCECVEDMVYYNRKLGEAITGKVIPPRNKRLS